MAGDGERHDFCYLKTNRAGNNGYQQCFPSSPQRISASETSFR